MSRKKFIQKSQGVRRSKSETESEKIGFPKTKRPDFFPVSSFCYLFMEVPPYLSEKNI